MPRRRSALNRWLVLFIVAGMLAACAPSPQLTQRLTPSLSVSTPSPTVPLPTRTAQSPTSIPTPSSTPSGTWISLKPDHGAPGDIIQVDGYYPGGLSQTDLDSNEYKTHADFCWNGCQAGLMDSGELVTWSRTAPGHFSTQFTVPPIPWLASDGVHQLTPGESPIDLIHLDPAKIGCTDPNGCPVVPDASASFTLIQAATRPDCSGFVCGSITASPAQASPGESVQVTGWAPLLQIIGTPFGYSLAIIPANEPPTNDTWIRLPPITQAMDGSFTGSFQVPLLGNNGIPLSPGKYSLALSADSLNSTKGGIPPFINPAPFEITVAMTWSEVQQAQPLWIQNGQDLHGSNLVTDPLDSKRMAYCAPGQIRYTGDGGQSWSAIPTAGVSQLPPDPLVTVGEEKPQCLSVMLDSTHPDTFYAVFAVVSKEYGAPPSYLAGYYTRDRGKNWQLAPVPSILSKDNGVIGNFGGYWTDGKIVQVMYDRESYTPELPAKQLIKQTSDGGATWSDAALTCPDAGPCLRLGNAPEVAWSMGAGLPQSILVSLNNGESWQSTGQAVELRQDGPHELAALSSTQALILSGSENYPLRYTGDGGKTWRVVVLPALPIATPGFPAGYPGLQILSDGSLIAMTPDTGQWLALSPAAQDWCVTGISTPNQPAVLFQEVGNRVYWFNSYQQDLQSAPRSALNCKP